MMELILNDICDSHLSEMLDYGSMKWSCSYSAPLVKTPRNLSFFVKCKEKALEKYLNIIGIKLFLTLQQLQWIQPLIAANIPSR